MLESWLHIYRHTSLAEATADDIRDFVVAHGRVTDHDSRELPSLACIKRFYFFLVGAGVRPDDPTERLYLRGTVQARQTLKLVIGKSS